MAIPLVIGVAMSFDLQPDHAGKYSRITIEQKVEDTGSLLELQQSIALLLPAFTIKSLDDLHVTFLHLGRMDDLLDEVRQAGSISSINEFLELMQPVLQAGFISVTNAMKVNLTALDCFGLDDDASVVVKLDLQASWLEKRNIVLMALEQCLKLCGVPDVDSFMASSWNLKFGTKDAFNPHVTLGTVPVGTSLARVMALSLPLRCMTLGPTIVRNAPMR